MPPWLVVVIRADKIFQSSVAWIGSQKNSAEHEILPYIKGIPSGEVSVQSRQNTLTRLVLWYLSVRGPVTGQKNRGNALPWE